MGEVKMNGKLTLAQSAFLEANSHLVPVEQLPDGDLLCLDREKWRVEPGDPSPGLIVEVPHDSRGEAG
jgi:hypothetical protein